MKNRQIGHGQETAAAKAGVSIRSGRRIEKGVRVEKSQRQWRTRLRLPNGVTTSYAWDNAYRLTAQITRNAAGVVLAAFSYSYDAANRRTSLTDMAGHSTTYAYDANSRLTAVAYGNGRTQSFTYDNVGNRLSQTVNGVTTTYSYDVADRLTSETTAGQTTTYAYDDNGNLLSRTSLAASGVYTFNQRNQLVGATAPRRSGRSVSDASSWIPSSLMTVVTRGGRA